jgi:transposase
MEITQAQFAQIEHCLPLQRGNVSLSNLSVLNAILYVAENGCKWRGLPKRFGNWHTIYTRMNRWSKAGVLDRVFEELQRAQVVRIRIEAVSLAAPASRCTPMAPGR